MAYRRRSRRSYRRSGGTTAKTFFRALKTYDRYKERRENKKAAWASVFGARGTPQSIGAFGKTYADADATQRLRRLAVGFRGSGDYSSRLASLGRWGLRLGGAAAGYASGGIGGAIGGWRSGAAASGLLGLGDYDQGVVTNNIVNSGDGADLGPGGQTPLPVNPINDTGDIFISHKEFIGNVMVSGTGGTNSPFEIRTFELNPGLPATFPFLSALAENYTMYKFHGCVFTFKTGCTDSSNLSISSGKVIMTTQYDPDAPAYTNSRQMENYELTCSSKPSLSLVHGIETGTMQTATNMLYVRTGAVNRDKIFTDYGLFQLATEGVPLSGTGPQQQIIGELWVSYKVQLSRARLPDDSDPNSSPEAGRTWNAAFTIADQYTSISNGDTDDNNDLGVNASTANEKLVFQFPTTQPSTLNVKKLYSFTIWHRKASGTFSSATNAYANSESDNVDVVWQPIGQAQSGDSEEDAFGNRSYAINGASPPQITSFTYTGYFVVEGKTVGVRPSFVLSTTDKAGPQQVYALIVEMPQDVCLQDLSP